MDAPSTPQRGTEDHATRFRSLARRILGAAGEGRPREMFVGHAMRLLLEDAAAERIVLRIREHGEEVARTLIAGAVGVEAHREPIPASDGEHVDPAWREDLDPKGIFTTRLGSVFANGDRLADLIARPPGSLPPHLRGIAPPGAISVAWVPLAVSFDPRAVILFARDRGEVFERSSTRIYEALAQILVVALDQQNAQWALAERIKELTCLYGVERVSGDQELALDESLDRLAATLPPAMQHPAMAFARIVVDGKVHATTSFRDGPHRLAADVVTHGAKRGVVEVVYRDDAHGDAPTFLREEHALLGAVAGAAGRLIERERTKREREHLEEQLRHADRLATIGTLAAGVAHELNEPLGSVLGLAQLAAKTPSLPDSAAADLDKIVRAALHAREIVRKLMLFARHEPPRKTTVQLDTIVSQALDLLAARCEEGGVLVERTFDRALPDVVADAAQIRQIVVNLVVNGIQAMPSGGTLRVRIAQRNEAVALEIADEGIGMDESTRRRIFTPFFTTKEVGEGTGLGLAVVHGIVTSHGGTIEVESAPGRGSVFRVLLPSGGSEAREPGTP